MSCCDRRYSATQYAMLTGLMGLAGAIAPAWSGYLVEEHGYDRFFLITIAAGIPGILLIPFIRSRSGSAKLVVAKPEGMIVD